jgi:sorting nexin-4
MDDTGGFDSVQWERDRDSRPSEDGSTATGFPPQASLPDRSLNNGRSGSTSSEPQAGVNADAVDLAGIGPEGILLCTVDSPLKENDGTKDAYVSYLVSTHVRRSVLRRTGLTLLRLISKPSKRATSPSEDDLPISCIFATHYIETFPLALRHLFLRRTIWHM